jgi:uncharacterized protein
MPEVAHASCDRRLSLGSSNRSATRLKGETKGWSLVFQLLLFAFSLAASGAAQAQTFPQLTGRVVDQAQLLTSEQIRDLDQKSQALESSTGSQFVIATVKSLEGYPIEDYAYRLGRAWKIGSAKKDDGVLLLVAPTERKVWITTGYGAGAFLTDAMSGVIIREAILPHFKQNPPDYGGGIEAGAGAIIKQMSLPPDQAQKNLSEAQQAQQQRQHSGGSGLPIIFWLMIIGFVLLSHFRRGHGRRYRTRSGGINPWVVLWGLNALDRGSRSRWGGGSSWSGGGWGGGSSGGFGGFSGGGGSFGGGGAGGSW